MSFCSPTSSKAERARHAQQSSQGREVHPKTLLKPPTPFVPFLKSISVTKGYFGRRFLPLLTLLGRGLSPSMRLGGVLNTIIRRVGVMASVRSLAP
jgi:hypothetical protein